MCGTWCAGVAPTSRPWAGPDVPATLTRRPRAGQAGFLSHDTRSGGAAVSLLAARCAEFRRRAEDFGADPPVEAVHQLRVVARRLRAALDLFAPLLQLPKSVRVGPLRRIERRLGALRDLDVLGVGLEVVRQSDPEAARAIAEELAHERDAALAESRRAHRRPALRQVLEALEEWLAAPRLSASAELPLGAVAPDLLLPVLGEVLLHPAWNTPWWPDPHLPEAAPLHHLRRRLKRLRYQADCLATWYGAGVTGWLDELHAMQDAIGAWHDAGLLLARLDARGVAGPARDRLLSGAMTALAPWPAWRGRYLDPRERAWLRGLLLAQESSRGWAGAAGGAAG